MEITGALTTLATDDPRNGMAPLAECTHHPQAPLSAHQNRYGAATFAPMVGLSNRRKHGRALQDLETVRDHITGSREALIEMPFYALDYGPPARTQIRRSSGSVQAPCDILMVRTHTIY
jgi:hypothetical protein